MIKNNDGIGLVLEAGCWILEAGGWMLDARFWMLEAGGWRLDAGCWMLDAGGWNLILDASAHGYLYPSPSGFDTMVTYS